VDVDRPVAIELPAGRARKLREAACKLIDDLKSALPAVFQSEEYQTRRGAINEAFQKKQGEAFSVLSDKAAQKDIALLRTPLSSVGRPQRQKTTFFDSVVQPETSLFVVCFTAWYSG
jgi:hypothetical protein